MYRPHFREKRDARDRRPGWRATRLIFIAAIAASASVRAGEQPRAIGPRDGDRIVFFGDSITQAGGFIADIECYLLTRAPEKRFRLFNHGKSGETISGTSETDHHPRRPDAHDRFTRDVTDWKPDLVVACFGMNDGNYHPFDQECFERYQAGVNRLIARVRDEARCRLILASPPPFDPYRRSVGDPVAREYGYRFPAVDYDQTLDHYARWLIEIPSRRPEVGVVDLHRLLNDHLARRRVGDVSFSLAGDAVHPGPTGHWLIAQAILSAWGMPAVAGRATIKGVATAPRVVSGPIRDLTRADDGALSFVWTTYLPMPFDLTWDKRSLELEHTRERFNEYELRVLDPPANRYRLFAALEGQTKPTLVAVVTREQLQAGLDLTALDRFPTLAIARTVRSRIVKRRQKVDLAWRKSIARPAAVAPEGGSAEFLDDDSDFAEIRQLCQPRDVVIRIVPEG